MVFKWFFKWFLNDFLNGLAIFKWFLNGFLNGRLFGSLMVTSLTSKRRHDERVKNTTI